MGIFESNAPRHWAAGLPVIPLMIGEKRPAIQAWQTYADSFPEEEDRRIWLEHYGENNMGMPLGACSGLVAIDIDALEPEIQAVIESVLPPSPWVRVGKKGSVRVYRFDGHRSVRIKSSEGQMIVEILSKGTQIAMPPSIHPDTQKPYTANCDLVDVLDKLTYLPRDIEDLLRSALEKAGVKLSSKGSASVTKWVPAGARDNAMVAHAGLLSRGILRGERTLREALDEITEWVTSFVEKVSGDDVSVEKAQQKLIEFLIRDVTGGRPLPEGWDLGIDEEDKVKMGLVFEEHHEIWTYERIKDYLQRKFQTSSEGSSERMEAIEFGLARIVANEDLSSIQVDSLVHYMVQISGREVSFSSLNKRIKELRQKGINGNDHTEIAEKLIEDFAQYGEIKFYKSLFWQWNGSHWEHMNEDQLLRHVAKEYGHLPAARKHNDHRGVIATASKLVACETLGEDITGINFANGFLTDNLNLLPHDPSYGATYCLPYRYMPDVSGHFPLFRQLLHDAWGRDPDMEDKIQALREALAVTMFGVAWRYQRAFCLFGRAGSGKSTIMEVMSGLLPDEAKCAIPPTKWGDRFEPVAMVDKLLNICGELSESKFIDGESMKLVVEGTPISVQYKGKNVFNTRIKAAHWFASNHIPRSLDSSGGFTRRWLIWEFNHSLNKEKKIERYHEMILADEIEAIASWAVEGILDMYHNHEYTIPSSTMVVLDEMAQANNTVRQFLKSCSRVEFKPGEVVREYDIYMEYRTFCMGTLGANPSQMKTFSSRMKDLTDELGFDRHIRPEGSIEIIEYMGLKVNKKAK